jgi:catechol 2,3-dioxygenase-like lactoylglutathione lyase family enzyme
MTAVECSCCGEVPRGAAAELRCHPEIVICDACLDWLNRHVAAQDGVRIVQVDPVFRVSDVDRAIDHYQRLGFSTDAHDETYAFAHRGNLTIHLARADDPLTDLPGAIYLHVDDAERLAEDWRRAGLQVTDTEDYDYGKREGAHVDPDGNVIRFGSPIQR